MPNAGAWDTVAGMPTIYRLTIRILIGGGETWQGHFQHPPKKEDVVTALERDYYREADRFKAKKVEHTHKLNWHYEKFLEAANRMNYGEDLRVYPQILTWDDEYGKNQGHGNLSYITLPIEDRLGKKEERVRLSSVGICLEKIMVGFSNLDAKYKEVFMSRFYDTKELRWVQRAVRCGKEVQVVSSFVIGDTRYNGPWVRSFEEAQVKIRKILVGMYSLERKGAKFFEAGPLQKAFIEAWVKTRTATINNGLAEKLITEQELDQLVADAEIMLVSPNGKVWRMEE